MGARGLCVNVSCTEFCELRVEGEGSWDARRRYLAPSLPPETATLKALPLGIGASSRL